MAPRVKLGGAVAVSDDNLDPKIPLLGRIVTYTHPNDNTHSGAKVVRTWAKHGLDPDDLPEARQPVHVFESAVRAQETRKQYGKATSQVNVDRIRHDGNECVYQVTRVLLNKQDDVIDHPKAMRVIFDKQFSRIDVEALEAAHYEALRNIEDAIRTDFDKSAKAIPGEKIRNAIRAQIVKIGGQNLRRKAGGLYFVPQTWHENGKEVPTAPVLEGLRGFVEDLFGDRGDFYAIPLADGRAEEAMVRKHTMMNLTEETREIMERAVQRVRQGHGQRPLRQEFVTKIVNDRRKLGAAIEQFNKLVGLNMDEVKQNITDLDKALNELHEFAATSAKP